MITSQKLHLLRLSPLIYLLLFSLLSFGKDFKITSLKIDNVTVEKAIVSYLLPNEKFYRNEMLEVGKTFPEGTTLNMSASTELTYQTPSGHYIKCPPGTKVLQDENGTKSTGKITVSWWEKLKTGVKGAFDFFGGPSTEVQAAVEGTEFTIESDGDNLKIDLNYGKVAVNRRIRVELNEQFIEIDTVPKREIFITETTDYLSLKNQHYEKKLDTIQYKPLDTEDKIDQFFKIQLSKQKLILTNGGQNSRLGYKLIEQGQDSLGKMMYHKAMDNGEINREKFIQASLILVEAYFRNNDLKNRSVWLDCALHFIELEHNNNAKKFKHFKDAGENKFQLGFGKDLVVSKQYYAWAYTVKLKLTGCLENQNQNPAKWLRDAKKLNDSLN